MRQFNENTITEAVLERFEKTPDPRAKEVMEKLVKHLHDFVRDVRPTLPEWMAAIDFLTRTGHKSTGKRQEFILMSDTLGVSMLVDAINHGTGGASTETTVLGPFYVEDPPVLENGADVSNGLKGQPLLIESAVKDIDGKPIAGAEVDIWHSDDDGFYDVQHEDLKGYALRGRFKTDANGKFHFWTIMPHFYPVPTDGPVGEMLRLTGRHPFRPAHVHFMVSAPGFQKVVTHVFADEDQYLDSDTVFAVKDALIRHFDEKPAGKTPDGKTMKDPWRYLSYEFKLPKAA